MRPLQAARKETGTASTGAVPAQPLNPDQRCRIEAATDGSGELHAHLNCRVVRLLPILRLSHTETLILLPPDMPLICWIISKIGVENSKLNLRDSQLQPIFGRQPAPWHNSRHAISTLCAAHEPPKLNPRQPSFKHFIWKKLTPPTKGRREFRCNFWAHTETAGEE